MLEPADKDQAYPVIRWLMTDARKRTGPSEFIEALAEVLLAAGVDVARISIGVPILHPQIFSFSRQLGRPLLLSSDFVAAGAASLGRYPLKGIGTDQEIFAPAGAG